MLILILILTAVLAAAEIPASAKTEMTFARLIATRVAMHLSHATTARGPERLNVMQANGRVVMYLGEDLLMIGKAQSRLSKRMRPVLRRLTRQGPVQVLVIPPHDTDWSTWIAESAARWEGRLELLRANSGVAPVDLLEQPAFGNWDVASTAERKVLAPITYATVLNGEATAIPERFRTRAELELRVLGLVPRAGEADLVDLNAFLDRNCGGHL